MITFYYKSIFLQTCQIFMSTLKPKHNNINLPLRNAPKKLYRPEFIGTHHKICMDKNM